MIGALIKALGFLFGHIGYLPVIVNIIGDVEKLSSRDTTGAQKKQAAEKLIHDALTGIFGLPGDDPLLSELDSLIDAIVGALNSLGFFGHKGSDTSALVTQGMAYETVATSSAATPTPQEISKQISKNIRDFVAAHPEFTPSHGDSLTEGNAVHQSSHGDSLRSQGLPTVAPK